jgi:hypothetical protein
VVWKIDEYPDVVGELIDPARLPALDLRRHDDLIGPALLQRSRAVYVP